MGVLFAAGMCAFGLSQGMHGAAALIGALVGGALFGAVMGPRLAAARRQDRDAVRAPGPQAYAVASRVVRGKGLARVTDAERSAAVDLARHRLRVLEGQRVWGTAVFVGVSAFATWFAVSRSPWWWLEVGFFAVVITATWRSRRRLRRFIRENETAQQR